jgi:methylenetetrahydrofolate--tRNA-(uracil-5-)-methyltransferase
MPPNFGLLPDLPERIRDKRARYGAYRDRALADLERVQSQLLPPLLA